MRSRDLLRRLQLPVLSAVPAPAPPSPHQSAAGVRVGLLTLGCDKNTVDSERLQARLAAAGADVTADLGAAEVVVVNTCGFIDVAKEESIESILEALALKRQGRVRAVVAMGCLVQRYKSELEAELPEVDLFLGLTEAELLVPRLRERGLLAAAGPVPTMERSLRRLATRSRHSAHLKVSEGCDHGCAFCAIPLMRGRHRSTPPEVLVAEAVELERQGVVELNLVSQDTTWYGRDRQRGTSVPAGEWFVGRPYARMAGLHAPVERATTGAGSPASEPVLLPGLLRRLLAETGIPWFRLFYMYPSGIRRDLVELMAAEPRLLPYLDMPIQHGADDVLSRMRRPERRATIVERIGWLREAVPDLTLRTTVIVGFPGETDEEFEALLELLEEVRFDRLGAFAYSVEEDTAAAALPGQIPESLKRERLERLLDVQRGITLERNEQWVGREVQVLIDEMAGRDSATGGADVRGGVGRTRGQAPEIDGVVHLADARGALPGQFVSVQVTDALEDDLIGDVRERSAG